MSDSVCSMCSTAISSQPLHCGRCHAQPYCSKQCQVQHWPSHKKACFTPKETKVMKQVARETTMKECATCKKTEKRCEKLDICLRCLTVRYCSKACQKKDWADHKLVSTRAYPEIVPGLNYVIHTHTHATPPRTPGVPSCGGRRPPQSEGSETEAAPCPAEVPGSIGRCN